ncbi:RbsD/FucU domain-containing protein [Nitratireductor sp. XY-223]|uniref:RbsD/FucU family protein n=1 Tax=Nitratireductor sp. XY-223 TaxID=2561926 RepID=UPI0010AAAC03|nr:RbsD/FucU domain-containing protein [Nitratireductor sp. XY-223]
MLRGLNPILSPDLLYILRAMGHGDDIVIADANFPAESMGQKVVRLDGLSATDVAEAVLSVMPLDSFVDDPAITMQVVDDPQATPPVVEAFQNIIEVTADSPVPIKSIERFAFYDRAKAAFAIVQTGEGRHYGNIILKKGVIAP